MKDLERFTQSADLGGGENNARLFQTLWRGKWIILAFPLVFGAAGWFYMKGLQPVWKGLEPLYEATARIIVGFRQIDPLRDNLNSGTRPINLLNQQRAIIKSEPFMRRVVNDPELLELRHFQEFRPGIPPIATLNEGLYSTIDAKGDQVHIHFQSPYKRDAVAVLDKVVASFQDYYREKKEEESKRLIQVLETYRETSFAELERIRVEVAQIKRDNSELINIGPKDSGSLISTRINEANTALSLAQNDLIVAEQALARIVEAKENPTEFLRYGREMQDRALDPSLQKQLDKRLNELQEKEQALAERRRGSTEEDKKVQEYLQDIAWLQQDIDEIYRAYAEAALSQANQDLRTASALRDARAGTLDTLMERSYELETAKDALAVLEARRAALQEEMMGLGNRVRDLDLSSETGALFLDVIDHARAAPDPVFPDPIRILGIAIACGMGLGVGIVLLRGHMDRRIWTVEEVPELLGTNVLAVFPQLPGGRRRARIGRIIEEEQGSLAAEAVRSVRTAATFGLPNDGKGVLLVTSSVSGEGKSVMASNLALALAQADRRTILVDSDLRKPQQNEIFGVIGKRGIGDVLHGACSLNKAIIRNVAKGLDLLTAGDPGGKAAELIESSAYKELIARLGEHYDCVIIDSGPVLETSEARVIASISDAVIFVLRLDVSSRPDAVRARDILQGVDSNLLGVLLNGSRPKRGAKAYAEGIAYGGYSYGATRRGDAESRVASRESESEGLEALR